MQATFCILSVKQSRRLGLVVHIYNPSTREVETGGLHFQGQAVLCWETPVSKINEWRSRRPNSPHEITQHKTKRQKQTHKCKKAKKVQTRQRLIKPDTFHNYVLCLREKKEDRNPGIEHEGSTTTSVTGKGDSIDYQRKEWERLSKTLKFDRILGV